MAVINAGNNRAVAKLSNKLLRDAINVAFERDEPDFARSLHETAYALRTENYGS